MPVGGLAVKQVVCFCAVPQQQSLDENKSTTTETQTKKHINNTQPSRLFSGKLLISLVSPCQFGLSASEVCYMQN